MNHKAFQLLLHKCSNLENLKKIHAKAITSGLLYSHQPLVCKLLNTYSKLGISQESDRIFTQIQNPDVVSWTSLINHYLHYEQPIKAFNIFRRLIHSGLRPDSYIVVSALSACGRNNDLLSGKAVHGMIFRFRLGSDPIVGNVLIDMYSRNGDIKLARRVFDEMRARDVSSWNSLLNGFIICSDLEAAREVWDKMPERNTISWTALITGYVGGERPVCALRMFRDMIAESKHCPSAVTLVAALAGCADIGAFNLGQCIQGCCYKINLNENVTVNNAMMDMYGKCGSLYLALKIFNEMAIKDVFSWTTMISGYAFHGNGRHALEIFNAMLREAVVPNEVTFLSVLSACSHAGLVDKGQQIFRKMINSYNFRPKIEHYGCMVDLLGRAGLLESAKQFIDRMPIVPDAVIWRSLLSACLVYGNLSLAKLAGKKVIEVEPDDDGVYVLLRNIYNAANMKEDALTIRKVIRDRKIKKTQGCSWIEVNGVVQYFAENLMQSNTDLYLVLEAITYHTSLDGDSPCIDL